MLAAVSGRQWEYLMVGTGALDGACSWSLMLNSPSFKMLWDPEKSESWQSRNAAYRQTENAGKLPLGPIRNARRVEDTSGGFVTICHITVYTCHLGGYDAGRSVTVAQP